MEVQYSPCNYIVNINPQKYGGQQDDYQQEICQCIDRGVRKIQEASQEASHEEASITALFVELLSDFCEARQNIAFKHSTNSAEKFGRRREFAHNGIPDFHFTFLDGDYAAYNRKFLSSIAALMQDMLLDRKSAERKTKKISDDVSSFELEIIEGEHLQKLKWNSPLTDADFPGISPALLEKKALGTTNSSEANLLMQSMKRLKESNIDGYKRMKMSCMFQMIQKNFPSPQTLSNNGQSIVIGPEANRKSFFVLGTSRLKINGKAYAASQFLTWLYRDFSTSPVVRMQKCSTTLLIHQDRFLIPETLQEISKYFA